MLTTLELVETRFDGPNVTRTTKRRGDEVLKLRRRKSYSRITLSGQLPKGASRFDLAERTSAVLTLKVWRPGRKFVLVFSGTQVDEAAAKAGHATTCEELDEIIAPFIEIMRSATVI